MDSVARINEHVFWVGMNDRESQLFESMWPLPKGVSYNSYLIIDSKIALLDTVKSISSSGYLNKLRQILPEGKQIDYLIVHHLEPDHSGSIPLLLDVFPQMKIIGTKKAAGFLKDLYNITENIEVVKNGDEMHLGQKTLRFFSTPMVHWPETMMSYEPNDGILFSGDAFGGFGTLNGGVFDDSVDIDYYEGEILRYFSNIVGKFSPMVQKAINKLKDLEISVVAPTHGPVWRKSPNRIIELYDRWSRHETEEGIVVAYGSMYGNTERMMEAIVRGIISEDFHKVRIHNVSYSHNSFVIRDIWRYKGLIIGSPTYDAGLFPPMDSLVRLLADKMVRNRCIGLFGSCGWSGGGITVLNEFVEKAGLELVDPVIEARFSATDEQVEQCLKLGRNVARVVSNKSS